MRHLLTASLIACAVPAAAQPACGPRQAIIEHLAQKWGETRRAAGLQIGSGVMEIFANRETGTWTIILTRPNGIACAVAAGEAWVEERAAIPGRDG